MMETVFYEEGNAAHNNFFTAGMNNINQLKRKMTLDLDFGSSGVGGDNTMNNGGGGGKQPSVIKKARIASLNTPNIAGLSSPDIHKLNMSSPDFERFVIQQTALLPTPTPTQSQIFFPRNVTEEQEKYVQGFTDALSKIRQQQTTTTTNSTTSANNTTTESTIISVSVSHPSLNNNTNIINTTSIPAFTQQVSFNPSNNTTIAHPHPPPSYHYPDHDQDSSDISGDDSFSENSNSTTSSSTYTTNGHHVSGPSNSQQVVNFPHHHRLPDYQMSMGATGTSGNIAAIPVSAAAIGSSSSSSSYGITIKEEQIVPSNPSSPNNNNVSPIDMASQEKIKLERKRQRNRVAASKCRKRKLERISKLEDKVKQLKGENVDLTTVLTKLKETVCQLKSQVLEHVNSGCQIMISNQSLSSGNF